MDEAAIHGTALSPDRVWAHFVAGQTPVLSTGYAYDPVGNRLSMTRNGAVTTYGYDRADRITTAGAVSYTVNANGNLVARGTDSFTYDQANRLIAATVAGSASTYAYDGDGKRTSKTVGGSTTSSVYDANRGLPVVLDDGTRKYVWGLGLEYAVSGTSLEVYHTDGLGSVRAITDGSAQVVETYLSDEFGVPTLTQGSRTQPFQYTGEQRDGETAFVYLRARVYDPQIGRFLQRDPWGGKLRYPLSQDRYAYASNSPISLVDPAGLSPILVRSVPDTSVQTGTMPATLLPPACLPILPGVGCAPAPHFPLTTFARTRTRRSAKGLAARSWAA